MRDVKIVKGVSGAVEFKAYGLCTDEHLSVLQRFYVMLFAGNEDSYRERTSAPLSAYIGGANKPALDIFNGILPILVKDALTCMDADDRALISTVSAQADADYNISCTIKFKDGTAVEGILNHE